MYYTFMLRVIMRRKAFSMIKYFLMTILSSALIWSSFYSVLLVNINKTCTPFYKTIEPSSCLRVPKGHAQGLFGGRQRQLNTFWTHKNVISRGDK